MLGEKHEDFFEKGFVDKVRGIEYYLRTFVGLYYAP